MVTVERKPITVGDQALAARCARGRIALIDDDREVLLALAALLELKGYSCDTYSSAVTYLDMLNLNQPSFPGPSCILCDVKLPEMDGLELQTRLGEVNDTPLLLMSGASGAPEAVSAFRAGALDFLIKPIDADVLLYAIDKALACSAERQKKNGNRLAIAERIGNLTDREREIVKRVALGQTNPAIADALGIALRTVKLHRQRGFEKLGVTSVVELVRITDNAGL